MKRKVIVINRDAGGKENKDFTKEDLIELLPHCYCVGKRYVLGEDRLWVELSRRINHSRYKAVYFKKSKDLDKYYKLFKMAVKLNGW